MTVVAPHNERDVSEQRAPTPEDEGALRLLSGLAVALGHGVQFDFLLADLATGVRRILDADRVSVLLLDEHERLTPAIAVARQQDADLWQTFRRMPPIALDDVVGAREALSAGDVLVVDDASQSPLVPSAWQRAFRLGSLAIAPLTIDRVAAGIVVVDHAEPGTSFSATDLALLEGMAALAGIALDGARRGSHAQRARAVSGALHELASAHSRRAVAEHTLAALLAVAQVSDGLVALVDGDDIDVVAVRGSRLPEPGGYSIDDVPPSIRDACVSAWSGEAQIGVVAATHDDGQPLVVVPMVARRRVVGAAVLPLALSGLSRDVVAELEVIATSCALALRARRHTDECDWLTRALTLATSRVDVGDPLQLTEEIRELLAATGVVVVGVVAERSVARALGLAAATGPASRTIARWQRGAAAEPVAIGAELGWPLVARGRVLGALLTSTVRSARSRERVRVAASLLSSRLAEALAETRIRALDTVAAQGGAHRAVAVRAYREAGQVLTLLAEQLRNPTPGDPRNASAARVMVEQARRLVRDAAGALAPDDVKQAGLRAAVTAAAEQVYAAGGPGVVVRQRGQVSAVDAAAQVALVRATRRLLTLLRDQRATTVAAFVETEDGQAVVRLRAAQLLSPLDGDDVGAHSAMSEARSWLAPVGGAARLEHDGENRLYVLTAPTDLRRPERSTPSSPLRETGGEVVPLEVTRNQ